MFSEVWTAHALVRPTARRRSARDRLGPHRMACGTQVDRAAIGLGLAHFRTDRGNKRLAGVLIDCIYVRGTCGSQMALRWPPEETVGLAHAAPCALHKKAHTSPFPITAPKTKLTAFAERLKPICTMLPRTPAMKPIIAIGATKEAVPLKIVFTIYNQ